MAEYGKQDDNPAQRKVQDVSLMVAFLHSLEGISVPSRIANDGSIAVWEELGKIRSHAAKAARKIIAEYMASD